MPLIHSVGSEANADIDVDEINNLAFLVNEQVEDVRDKVKRFSNKQPSLFAKGTGENSLALRTKLACYCPLREAQITSTAAVPARKSGRVRIKVFSLRALVLPIHLSLQASNRKAASSSAATASKILLIYPDAEVSVAACCLSIEIFSQRVYSFMVSHHLCADERLSHNHARRYRHSRPRCFPQRLNNRLLRKVSFSTVVLSVMILI